MKATLRVINIEDQTYLFELCIPNEQSEIFELFAQNSTDTIITSASKIAYNILENRNLNHDIEVKELEHGYCK